MKFGCNWFNLKNINFRVILEEKKVQLDKLHCIFLSECLGKYILMLCLQEVCLILKENSAEIYIENSICA